MFLMIAEEIYKREQPPPANNNYQIADTNGANKRETIKLRKGSESSFRESEPATVKKNCC